MLKRVLPTVIEIDLEQAPQQRGANCKQEATSAKQRWHEPGRIGHRFHGGHVSIIAPALGQRSAEISRSGPHGPSSVAPSAPARARSPPCSPSSTRTAATCKPPVRRTSPGMAQAPPAAASPGTTASAPRSRASPNRVARLSSEDPRSPSRTSYRRIFGLERTTALPAEPPLEREGRPFIAARRRHPARRSTAPPRRLRGLKRSALRYR